MEVLRSVRLREAMASGTVPDGQTTWFYENLVPKTARENIRWRRLLWELSQDEQIQQDLLMICSRDMLFYINSFGWTLSPKEHPRCPIQPFITYPFQDRALLELQQEIGLNDIAAPKSRDLGASWMCLLALEHYWHFVEMQQFLLTSQVEELVDGKSEKALFRKLDFWWSYLPEWLKPRPKISRTHKAAVNLSLGSRFNGQATVPNLARGDRPTAILLDEAAEMPNAGMIASATRDATNCRIYNSTPNGRFGTGQYFFEVCKNPSIKKIWMHWSEHPVKAKGLYKIRRQVTEAGSSNYSVGDWIADRELDAARAGGAMIEVSEPQKVLLDWKTYRWQDDYDFARLRFKEGEKPRSDWYDKQCARDSNAKRIAKELDLDFEGSTEKLASSDLMAHVRETQCKHPIFRGEVLPSETSLAEGLEHLKPIWVPGGGHWELWCDLPENRPPRDSYSIGIDISGGTGGAYSSQSVMSVWSNTTGIQAAEWRSFSLSPDELGIRAAVCAKWFWNAFVVPEINGPSGTRFLNKLLECQYWNIYRRNRSEEEVVPTATSKLGYYNSKGAEGVLRGLLAALTTGEAKLRSCVCAEQLEEYEFDAGKVVHKASAESESESDKGRQHGDAAVAAGMGWLGVETLKQLAGEEGVKAEEPQDIPMHSFAWRMRERRKLLERAEENSFAW